MDDTSDFLTRDQESAIFKDIRETNEKFQKHLKACGENRNAAFKKIFEAIDIIEQELVQVNGELKPVSGQLGDVNQEKPTTEQLLAEAVGVMKDLICDIHSPNDLLGKGYVCGLTTKQQLAVIRAREVLAKLGR